MTRGTEATDTPPPNRPARDSGDAAGALGWRSLHETVTGRLRDMIVEGHLEEGARIVERELCERFGISRTPLREAFKVLAGEGLIELQPNRGAVVSKLGPAEARDMLRVIARLEALAGELACAEASDQEIAEIRRMHERMLELYRAADRLPYFQLNQDIHLAIVRAARNPTLSAAHLRLHARMKRIRFRGNDMPENWAEAVADHQEIIEALERRDGPPTALALQRHLDKSWVRLAASLSIAPDTMQPLRKVDAP